MQAQAALHRDLCQRVMHNLDRLAETQANLLRCTWQDETLLLIMHMHSAVCTALSSGLTFSLHGG